MFSLAYMYEKSHINFIFDEAHNRNTKQHTHRTKLYKNTSYKHITEHITKKASDNIASNTQHIAQHSPSQQRNCGITSRTGRYRRNIAVEICVE